MNSDDDGANVHLIDELDQQKKVGPRLQNLKDQKTHLHISWVARLAFQAKQEDASLSQSGFAQSII
jgi:hypothetical protein